MAQPGAFGRVCSSTQSEAGQFRNTQSGRGYSGQICFANEESSDEGRVFGVLPDRTTQQLPRLGQASWENTKPAYNRTDTTLTIGNEDGVAGDFNQLHIYRGTKRSRGNAFDRVGLTDGTHYVLNLVDESVATDSDMTEVEPGVTRHGGGRWKPSRIRGGAPPGRPHATTVS